MKKKYWLVNSNSKNNKYWIESVMLDPTSDYFRDYKSAYSETIIEAKTKLHNRVAKEIDKIESKIKLLEYKKKQLKEQLLNPEIRDE